MGHPIHKHMGGMKSAERYDAKEAYNKDLSSKARMHYLENDIADKKGVSRKASPLNDFKGGYHKVEHAKGEAHNSPASNLNKGYKSQMGKPSVASMNVDPAEAVMAGARDTREGAGAMSRKTSPLNGHGYHAKKKK
jgi:hypothetical protein